MMDDNECNAFYFKAAWYVNFGIAYFHLFALVLFFLARSSQTSPIRVVGGYLLNALLILFIWSLLSSSPSSNHGFSCLVIEHKNEQLDDINTISPLLQSSPSSSTVTTVDKNDRRRPHYHNTSIGYNTHEELHNGDFIYHNPLSFPALDASLLAHLGLEILTRCRHLLKTRHVIVLATAYCFSLGSMFWFHVWWHIIVSLFMGIMSFVCWQYLLYVIMRLWKKTTNSKCAKHAPIFRRWQELKDIFTGFSISTNTNTTTTTTTATDDTTVDNAIENEEKLIVDEQSGMNLV